MLIKKYLKCHDAPRSESGGSPHAALGLRPPLPAPNTLSVLIHFGVSVGRSPAQVCFLSPSVLNERLLTLEPVRVRGGRGRVHENFPLSGKTLLIEQVWLLTASS